MELASFKDMYIAELQELRNLEMQLCDALPRIAVCVSHSLLKNALIYHQKESKVQGDRLESILERHGANPRAHTDQAMQALIVETEKMLKMVKSDLLRDAAIIASVQKIKHYEIAAYGTAATLAGQLDLGEEQTLLHDSLEEEKGLDALLTSVAKSEVNHEALAA